MSAATTFVSQFEISPARTQRTWTPARWSADVEAQVIAMIASEEKIEGNARKQQVLYFRIIAGTGFKMAGEVGKQQKCVVTWSESRESYVIIPDDAYIFLIRKKAGVPDETKNVSESISASVSDTITGIANMSIGSDVSNAGTSAQLSCSDCTNLTALSEHPLPSPHQVACSGCENLAATSEPLAMPNTASADANASP